MIKRSFLYLIICNITISCNFYQSESHKTDIKIKLKYQTDDIIQLFYVEHPLDNFTEKKSISKHINGQNHLQEVIFNLPEHIIPLKIRIDLGNNRFQNYIIIDEILISKMDTTITINRSNFNLYLVSNSFVVSSTSLNEFKLEAKNGNYDPYLLSTPSLIKKLIDLQ